MMDQLGIKALRPGPSGNEKAPNHANYDESEGQPLSQSCPTRSLMNDGTKVTTPKMWWDKRRPEIVEMFEKYVYGRVPNNVPKVNWTVTAVDHEMIGFTPVIAKDLIGEVDNSSYPAISVQHSHDAGDAGERQGTGARPDDVRARRIPGSERTLGRGIRPHQAAWKAMLIQQDPSLKDVFAQHPAWEPVKATPFQFPQLNEDGDLPNTWQLVAAGWGFVLVRSGQRAGR